MAQNIEFKARCRDLETVRQRALLLATEEPKILNQVDYFFEVPKGRLKLRIIDETVAQLIPYQRSDENSARPSDYLLHQVSDPESLKSVLCRSLNQGPVVKKSRELIMVGRTRIHLDQVESLGTFIEIEVVLSDDELAHSSQGDSLNNSRAMEEMNQLKSILGIDDEDILSVAYVDLLKEKAS